MLVNYCVCYEKRRNGIEILVIYIKISKINIKELRIKTININKTKIKHKFNILQNSPETLKTILTIKCLANSKLANLIYNKKPNLKF